MIRPKIFHFFLGMILIFLSGCTSNESIKISGYVDLKDLRPLKPVQHKIRPLRVAVASVVSPKGTILSYEPFLKYLEGQFHRPVELVQRRTYMETNKLISEGKVDIAFVCTSAYIAGHDEFGMELLVAPQVNGKLIYYSYLIVPKDSTAQSIEDLQNKTFAFTDPISLSGRMYPIFLIQELGFNPDTFFSKTFYTYNHDEAIRAVANKIADGAAVDSLVYEFAIKRDPSLFEKVRVIHRSPPFGIPPIVVSPNIDENLKIELKKTILLIGETVEGRNALNSLGIDNFTNIEDKEYDNVRTLLSDVEKYR